MEYENTIDVTLEAERVGGALSLELSDASFSAVMTDTAEFSESSDVAYEEA